jgi:HEAT repeat protein
MKKAWIRLAYVALFFNVACASKKEGDDELATILASLKNESRERRLEAINLLEERCLGPETDSVVHALVAVLEDDDDEVRGTAVAGLGSIGSPACDALLRTLASGSERAKVAALIALEHIRPHEFRVVRAVTHALRDGMPSVRMQAAGTLGGFRDLTTVPSLIEFMAREENAEVRAYGTCALMNFDPVPSEAIPTLIEILSRKEKDAQEAAWALGQGGWPAVGPLIVVLSDPMRKPVHCMVIRSLADIGPEAAAAVSLLKEKLKSDDEAIRRETIWALGEMGADAGEAVNELKKILPTELPSHRVFIAESISKIAPDDPLSCEVLSVELRNPDWDIRNKSAWALERMGPKSAKAVPALVTALSDPNDDVRKPAAIALGAIGPKAKEGLKALQVIAGDVNEKPSIRDAAREAIKKIGRE